MKQIALEWNKIGAQWFLGNFSLNRSFSIETPFFAKLENYHIKKYSIDGGAVTSINCKLPYTNRELPHSNAVLSHFNRGLSHANRTWPSL